jgi:hypothetical protein
VEQASAIADGLEVELAAARQEAADLRTEREELKTAHEQVGKSIENPHERISP